MIKRIKKRSVAASAVDLTLVGLSLFLAISFFKVHEVALAVAFALLFLMGVYATFRNWPKPESDDKVDLDKTKELKDSWKDKVD